MELYRKYHKELIGKVFVATSIILKDREIEYEFVKSSHSEFGRVRWEYDGTSRCSDDYGYEEIFYYLESGAWKIINYKHLMVEKRRKNSIFAF